MENNLYQRMRVARTPEESWNLVKGIPFSIERSVYLTVITVQTETKQPLILGAACGG